MLNRLERQSVPFIVMVRAYERDLRAQMPELDEFLSTRYAVLAHIDVAETPGVDVYLDRAKRSTGMDAATGWPCFH